MSDLYNRSVPLYYQLENILRSRIDSGEVQPHHRLPTEQELSQEYGISRATVRQALAALVSEGLLYRKQGRGTFVTEKARQTRTVKLTGFTEDLFFQGVKPEIRILEARSVSAPERIAGHLGIPPGIEVTRFKRVRSVEGTALSLMVNHLPPAWGQRISDRDLTQHTMLWVLEEKLRIPLGMIRQSVEAVKADAEIASHLKASVFDPILYIESVVQTVEGRPVEVADTYFRADRYKYTVELIRDRRLAKPAPAR